MRRLISRITAPTSAPSRSCGRAAAALGASAFLAGCAGQQSALDPAGPQARAIADLFWIFVAVAVVVWVLVMAALAGALLRRRAERHDPLEVDPSREGRSLRVIAACAGATALVMIALTLTSFFAQRTLLASPAAALRLEVRGHQWWWEVRYQDPRPDRTFVTANEIHVPVGQLVGLDLQTDDVIHSFWVPSLAGKMDQITGHANELQLVADRPGIYRGQCAEFCGRQHAKMAFLIVASAQDEFAAWREAQLRPAAAPSDAQPSAGQQVFFARGCALCHAISGTPAGGSLGPDLTHLASRRTLAAGTTPFNAGALAAWIADPQHIKPGTQMPAVPLTGPELSTLVAYLMGLK